jgi:hypothetical protein
MATVSVPRPRVKPARTLRVLCPLTADRAGLISITAGKVHQIYRLRRLPADFGGGFRLTKVDVVQDERGVYGCRDGESYDVDVAGTCECLGYFKHGHCKHLDGLRKLATLGLI